MECLDSEEGLGMELEYGKFLVDFYSHSGIQCGFRTLVIKLLTILAAFLGFLPVSNPFGSIQKFKFHFISIVTLLSLFQLVYPALYISYALEVLASAPGRLSLTEKFMTFTLAPAACFSGAVTRLGSILNCGKTIKLTHDAMEVKSQMACAGFQGRRSKWTKWVFLFACTSWVLMFPAKATVNLVIEMKKNEGQFLSLANSAWIYEVLYFIALFRTETTQAYAFAFNLIAGVYLLDLQDTLSQLLCAELDGTVQEDSLVTVATVTVGSNNAGHAKYGRHQLKQMFSDQFKIVKNLFLDYETIAGWYVLALSVATVAGLTQAVCDTVFQRASFSENVGGLIEVTSVILLLAFFGEFLKNDVSP